MITVIGHDGGPLRPEARTALSRATCVAGVPRHLDVLPVPETARRIDLTYVVSALDAVTGSSGAEPGDGKDAHVAGRAYAVVVASGDPGFFGIVRALRARGAEPRVIPAVSSVALAFAALGLPWDDALVVSAHGRSPRRALAAALAHPKTAILTAPGTADPAYFIDALLGAGRRVHVAERLGTPDERLTEITAKTAHEHSRKPGDPADAPGVGADRPVTEAITDSDHAGSMLGAHSRTGSAASGGGFGHPNVLITYDPARTVGARGWLAGHPGAPDGWALPEPAYDHRDGQVTKAEVRALALARLAPRPGVTVWDVGAGSGSISVECARFGAYAVAVERDADQCLRVQANAARHGAYVQVVAGSAPEALAGLPDPDAVFVGGGDAAVLDAVLRRAPARVVVALASIDRVRPVRDALRAAGYATDGCQLQSGRLADLPNGSIRLDPANPVTLVWGGPQ